MEQGKLIVVKDLYLCLIEDAIASALAIELLLFLVNSYYHYLIIIHKLFKLAIHV